MSAKNVLALNGAEILHLVSQSLNSSSCVDERIVNETS